jgi:regulator of protease activity HflC (stomatin/prohibitin superfamily)
MFGFNYFKADPSTFVIKSVNGKARTSGKGLSFWYYTPTTSIAALPISAQETPFIFNLQTSDFQSIRIQGQVSFLINAPEVTATAMNFNLKNDGATYVSEDPLKLGDNVLRVIQTIIQNKIQSTKLRSALVMNKELLGLLQESLANNASLKSMGLKIMDISIEAIVPSPETAKALEAEARESILKEADDAIYARRKFSVEQERTIQEAELETELSIQQKQQELAEARLENERALLREQAAMEQERLESDVKAEKQRQELVSLSVENQRAQSDADAYAIEQKMKAYRELPVESLKAMAMAKMSPEQLMATAIESLASNAGKIGELNLGPDLISQFARKVAK